MLGILQACQRQAWGLSTQLGFVQLRKSSIEKSTLLQECFFLWSGLRGSNPPPPPWQGGALPNELNPRAVSEVGDSDGARTHDL